jgi:signal transduction histidine kinase
MKKPKRWSARTRLLLTLQLAVVLPAATLIILNIGHLSTLQRDHGVEAAIQRDFYEVMAIADKHISAKAEELLDPVREAMAANSDSPSKLDAILQQYPYAAHIFTYDSDRGFMMFSQDARIHEKDFHAEAEQLHKVLSIWMEAEYGDLVKKGLEMQSKGKSPYMFDSMSVERGEKRAYTAVALFALPATEHTKAAIAGAVFDVEYLRDKFFPQMLNEAMASNAAETRNEKKSYAAMMVHMKNDPTPLAASTEWDGGTPEVERNIEGAFPGLRLAMKLPGTTLANIGQRFVRMSYLILTGLSLALAAGIVLTYRNVSREVALARLKSDFVSNVSHELRTPLALIRLYAETLELGRLGSKEKQEEYYRIIRKESERLTALINNILDFSRIEAGRKEYDFRETNLAELVRNTLDSYRYQIEQNGFALRENISEDVPAVQVDREAIARSLLNLVNNALKYSRDNKYLGVNLYRDNGSVKLEVIDHGIGIPRAEQHKIFEKFYRVGDPLVHNTKGSGLGLSLVRHIVQAHGGMVSVESTPGEGSKFTIALPTNPAVSGAQAAAAN